MKQNKFIARSQRKQLAPDRPNPLPSYLRITRDPSWAHLNNIPPWSNLYQEVWIDNKARWGDSSTHRLFSLPSYDRMWDMFGRAASLLIQDLASVSWNHVSPSDLVALYELYLCVEIGIRALGPPEIIDLHWREMLFFDTIIRKAILDHKDGSRLTPKYALAAYTGCVVGPVIEAEMHRRDALHIGSHAAILKWYFALCQDNKAGFDIDARWKESQKMLMKLIARNLANRLGRYPSWQLRDITGEMPEWIWQTLGTEREYAGMDPFQALIAAYKGKLNIFPRRVADRICNSLRPTIGCSVKAENPLLRGGIAHHGGTENPDNYKECEVEERETKAVIKTIIRDYRDETRRHDITTDIEKFLKKHPKHRDAVEVELEVLSSDKTYKTLAAERGISDRALRLRLEKFKNDFKHFMICS